MEHVMSVLKMRHNEAWKYMHRADCAKHFNYIQSNEPTERLASRMRKQCGQNLKTLRSYSIWSRILNSYSQLI